MIFDDNKKSHRIWRWVLGVFIFFTVQVVYKKTQQKRPHFTQQQLKNLRVGKHQDSIKAIIKRLEEINEKSQTPRQQIILSRLKHLQQQPRCEDVEGLQIGDVDLVPKDYTGVAFACFDGKIQAMGTYKEGKRDGLVRGWYENGQLMLEHNFKDGKDDGFYRFWYENGQLEFENKYKNGKLDGPDWCWYENGQMLWDGNYKGGREVGLHRMWYENGQLSEKAEYQEGVLISLKCYDINGNEEKCE